MSKDIGAAALKGEEDLWNMLREEPMRPHPVDKSRAPAERAVCALVELVLGMEAMTIVKLAIVATDSARLL